MDYPWYVITGDVNIDNFTKLYTQERGFIWRGFTYESQMIPTAANYNEYGEKVKCLQYAGVTDTFFDRFFHSGNSTR